MNRGKIIIWVLVAIFLIVVGYVITQLAKIKKAVFKYAGIRVKSISLNRIELIAYLKLVNEGSLSVTISNQEYDVYLNDKFLTHMKYSQPFKIRPGLNIMPLEIYINLSDVIKAGWANLSQLLTDKSKVNIRLAGAYDLKIGFLSVGKRPFTEIFNLGQTQKQQESGYREVCACAAPPPGVKDDWCWCTKKEYQIT